MGDFYKSRTDYLEAVMVLKDVLDEIERFDAYQGDVLSEQVNKIKNAVSEMENFLSVCPNCHAFEKSGEFIKKDWVCPSCGATYTEN